MIHNYFFVASMFYMNMSVQVAWFGKCFITRYTFVIFVAFKNCVDVLLQISCMGKWFATRFTFVIFTHSWTAWMCLFKYSAWENDLWQNTHSWSPSLWPSWTESMCFFRVSAWENDLPQDSHLCFLWSSWTVMCFFNFCFDERFCRKIHICSLCGLHELCRCVFSNDLLLKMICHKIHIWQMSDGLLGLHKLLIWMCFFNFCLDEKFLPQNSHL